MRLKVEEDSTIAEKKRKLDAMGQEQLERWLCGSSLPHAAAVALGFEAVLQPPRLVAAPALESSANAYSTPASATQVSNEFERAAVERWERIELLPGLDLIVRADAREPARLVAQQIREVYSMK